MSSLSAPVLPACRPRSGSSSRAGRVGRRRREGLRGRRPYPVRRGDRPDRARQPDSGMARRRHADQDRGHLGSLLCAGLFRRAAPAARADAAADEQSRQLHRLARRGLPLSGAQGRSARRRNLSGLRRGRGPVREQCGRRRRHRRHGHRQGRRKANPASPAAWSCAANTRCSPKAPAAACRRR